MNYFHHPLYLLFASILVLFLGPLLSSFSRGNEIIRDIIDGFTMIMIVLLVSLFILPHTIKDIGFLAIVMIMLGIFLPSVFEKVHHHVAKHVHYATIFIVMTGIAAHAFIDGVALIAPYATKAIDHHHAPNMLPIAVILHRLPVGLAIWTLLRPLYGNRRTIIMLLIIAIATVVGCSSGFWLVNHIDHKPFGYFEALVAGLLLHILFHRKDPYESKDCHSQKTTNKIIFKWGTGIGAILGFAVILMIQKTQSHGHLASPESIVFWNLIMVSAPALVIAYLCAGFINIFLPQSSIHWLQKGTELKQAISGLLFGLPLPVCSCGVVPLYRSLVKKGIPLSAGITFFIATPELGIDAILITIPLLGTQFTAIRLIAATTVALLVGVIIGLIFSKQEALQKNTGENNSAQIKETTIFQKIKDGLWIGLGDMVDHTAPWILFGLGIAAATQPYFEHSRLLFFIPDYLQVPLFALLGMPIYICASGITPFVAVLIYHGISPGAAIAFMLTGPATNITTLGILSQLHGKKLAITFASLIVVISVGVGFLINHIHIALPKTLILSHETSFETHRLVFLLILISIYAFSLLRCGPQAWARKIISGDVPEMDEPEGESSHKYHCCC